MFNVYYCGSLYARIISTTKWEAIDRICNEHYWLNRSKVYAKKD
jgi:hypothetical protein